MTVSKLATVSLLSLALATDAFVPTTYQAQYQIGSGHKSNVDSSPGSPTLPRGARMQSTSSTTALSANFFERFFRVANANVNKLVSNLENPEKIVLQAVEDMQNDLVRIRQAYASATASQRRLERQRQQVDAEAMDWQKRAKLALQRGKEDLAREALARRQPLVEKSKGLQQQLNIQSTATDKLYSAMMELESKIQEAAAKKEQLVARARTAKSTQMVNDMLSGLTGRTSMDAFTRMEEKVEALEAAAEASLEMAAVVPDSVEADFRMLEMSSEVDDELAKMKQDMKLLSSSGSISGSTTQVPIRNRVSVPVGRGEKIYIQ